MQFGTSATPIINSPFPRLDAFGNLSLSFTISTVRVCLLPLICDYWWNLSNIQYFANGRANGIFAEYRQGTGGSGQEKQATANIRDSLSGVLDHAVSTALVPIKYDLRIDKDAEIIPFAYASETYASLLSQIQQWRPNMAAWFEYGADDSATLVIADHAHLPDVVLDLSAVDVSALSLKARPDLVPPAVGLTCNASVVSRVQRALAVYPSGASLSQPYVVTAEVDVPGGVKVSDTAGQYSPAETGSLGYDAPRMIVRGDKFPTGTAQWAARVKRWAPALEDCAGLEVAASPKITSITPADAEHRGDTAARPSPTNRPPARSTERARESNGARSGWICGCGRRIPRHGETIFSGIRRKIRNRGPLDRNIDV